VTGPPWAICSRKIGTTLPAAAEIVDAFVLDGFALRRHEAVPHMMAASVKDLAEKAAFRADTTLVRLSDVAPDGTVTQVTGAAMNGTHRASARDPRAIVPGEPFELEVEMHFTSWVFPKGHRIRLDIQPRDGLGSAPYTHYHGDYNTAGKNTVYTGGKNASYILLPIIPSR